MAREYEWSPALRPTGERQTVELTQDDLVKIIEAKLKMTGKSLPTHFRLGVKFDPKKNKLIVAVEKYQ